MKIEKKYKVAKKELKLAITTIKTIIFECLYVHEDKSGDKKFYELVKAREKRTCDLNQLKCIKDEDNKVLVKETQMIILLS